MVEITHSQLSKHRSIWPRPSIVLHLRYLGLLMALTVQGSCPFWFCPFLSKVGELLPQAEPLHVVWCPTLWPADLEGERHPLVCAKWLYLRPFVYLTTDFVIVTVPFGIISSFTITLASFSVLGFLYIEDTCLPWLCSLRKTVEWTDTMDKNQSAAGHDGIDLWSEHSGGRLSQPLPLWFTQPSPSGKDFIWGHASQPGLLVINQKCIFYVVLIYIYLML